MEKSQLHDSRHHKKCRSNGGSNDKSNISIVTKIKHQSWHNLFANMTPLEIANEINEVWLDPAFKFIVEKKN